MQVPSEDEPRSPEQPAPEVTSPPILARSLPAHPKTGRLFGVMLLVSLGLHGVVLWMPLPSKQSVPPKSPPKSVRVVQLPGGNRSQPIQPRLKAQPTQPKPRVKPRLRPAAPPAIKAATKAVPSPSSTPETDTPPQAPANSTSSWDDFPHYPTATPGCFGLDACRQASATLSQVSTFFATTLPRKQYIAQLVLNEAERQVYQVSKGADHPPQFLTVMTGEQTQGTVYVLSDAPRQLSDLAQAKEVPVEVYSVLNDLGSMDTDASTFAQPDAYYQPDGSLRPQVLTTQLLMDQAFDQLMAMTLKSNLQAYNFQVSEPLATYGGGAVHQLTKDSLTLYVNLIPTQDGSGTLIIFWKTLPTSG